MGRHRKPTATGLRLARVGALTVMATAPLGLVGTALAAPLHVPTKHGHSDSDEDSDSGDRYLSHPDGEFTSDFTADSDDNDGDDNDGDGHDADSHDADDSDGHANHYRGYAHYAEQRRHADDVEEKAERKVYGTVDRHRSSSSSGRHSAVGQAESTAWDRLARCESTNNWSANTGNGYKGGLQFTDSTWRAYGGSAYAHSANQASREEQIAVAKKVQRSQGWGAWPSCSRKMGLA